VVACTPHPGFGTVSLRQGAIVRVVDLATCSTKTANAPHPRVSLPTLTVRTSRTGARGTQSIVYRGKTVYTVRERYERIPGGSPGPIWPIGVSPDGQWILFAIDPQNSASLAADGLLVEAVSVHGGKPHAVAGMLMYENYRAWCGGRLVLTAGGDRIAWHDKRLVTTAPPHWRVQPLVRAPSRAWGSLACAPDGRSVVVQSQPASTTANFWTARWALWRVGLHGGARQLTHPPQGFADESPRISGDGRTILFVRSHKGRGRLYALRGRRVVGPLLSVGFQLGYYGAHDWWQSMTWSLAPSR
jgi:hypothetical protein